MPQRIGLLTLPLHTNYGGILQAAALYRVLERELHKDVVFLERGQREWPTSRLNRVVMNALTNFSALPTFSNSLAAAASGRPSPFNVLPRKLLRKLLKKAETALRDQRIRTHQPFLEKYIARRSGRLGSTQALSDAVENFRLDGLVVGSDQVWRPDYFPSNAEEDYFLGFAPQHVRKIAYAASFGHGSWKFPQNTSRTKELITRFDAVSVREASGIEICAKEFDRQDAVHVIDPTMLVDVDFYKEITGHRTPPSRPILLSYVLDDAPDRQEIVKGIRTVLGNEYFYQSLGLDTGLRTVGIREWLQSFMDADFVITDSFHGMVFSIIFRKNFVAIINQDRGADRFESIAKQLNLENRLVDTRENLKINELVQSSIDFDAVHKRLAELRSRSINFLAQATN